MFRKGPLLDLLDHVPGQGLDLRVAERSEVGPTPWPPLSGMPGLRPPSRSRPWDLSLLATPEAGRAVWLLLSTEGSRSGSRGACAFEPKRVASQARWEVELTLSPGHGEVLGGVLVAFVGLGEFFDDGLGGLALEAGHEAPVGNAGGPVGGGVRGGLLKRRF